MAEDKDKEKEALMGVGAEEHTNEQVGATLSESGTPIRDESGQIPITDINYDPKDPLEENLEGNRHYDVIDEPGISSGVPGEEQNVVEQPGVGVGQPGEEVPSGAQNVVEEQHEQNEPHINASAGNGTPSTTDGTAAGASTEEAKEESKEAKDKEEGKKKESGDTADNDKKYVVSDTLMPLALPKGFAMDTPGILTCTEPVTAESIRNLQKFIDEHHAELVMTGKWAKPTAISFSPHDSVTGQRTVQKLDSELAEALSDTWVITRMEARAGSLEIVPGQDGTNPLNKMQDLSHLHMWGGFALAGDVDVQRNMLMSSHPMHISVGITGDGNSIQKGLLASVEKLGVYVNGSDGTVNLEANALAMNPIFENSGPGMVRRGNQKAQADSIENVEAHKLTDTEYVHLTDFRDGFQKVVTQIDMGNKEAITNLTSMLDGLDGMEGSINGFSVNQSYKITAAAYFGMNEAEAAKMTNADFANSVAERLTMPLVKDFDQDALIKALTDDSVLDTAGVSTEKAERNGAKGAINDAVKGLRKAVSLSPAEQDRNVASILSSNPVFAKLVTRGGIADELFDTTRRDTIAAIRQMPDTMFAEMRKNESGESVLKGFRFMNSSDEARHAAVQRDLDSQVKLTANLLNINKRLEGMTLPSTEKKDVKISVNNLDKLLDKATAGGIELNLSEMCRDALGDAKASQEMIRGGDGKNVGNAMAFHSSSMSFGTGALAGTDASFYGEAEVKSAVMIKTASEMLEQILNLDSHIVSIANNYSRIVEEKMAKGEPLNAEAEQKAKALESIRAQMRAEGAGSLYELRRNTSNNIMTLKKNAEQQKEVFKQAFRMAIESGMSPRDFGYMQRAVDKAVRENDTKSLGKDNPITSMLITYSEMQKGIEESLNRIKTGMTNVYDKLGDALVPKEPKLDEEGKPVYGKDGKLEMVPMFPDAEDRREITNELFARFNGVEPYLQDGESIKGMGNDMVVDIEAKWLTFKHYAGIDGKDPNKLLVVHDGGEFGRGALQGSGIGAVEGKREFVDKHEYDELYSLHDSNQKNTAEALKGIKEELSKMGVEAKGDLSDWSETFKPAFEQVLSDESLEPETKERLNCLAEKCRIACNSLRDSQEWLSKNSDFREYRFNKSPQGAEINKEINRIKKDLAREGLPEPQRLQLENALKQKLEEKDEVMQNGLMTKCHGLVSDEVKNVDLNTMQCSKGEHSFPNAFNENDTEGSTKNIDLDHLPKGQRLRGRLMECGEATAAITTDILKNYHHMTVSESVANVLLLSASVIGKWGKMIACGIKRESLSHKINKGIAWNQIAPLVDPSNNPAIVFRDDKGTLSQNVKFASPEAQKKCEAKGISIVNNGRSIEVDMEKLTAGKYTGTATFNAEMLRWQTAQKQIPGCAKKENIEANEKLLNNMDWQKRDRVVEQVNKYRKKHGMETIPLR